MNNKKQRALARDEIPTEHHRRRGVKKQLHNIPSEQFTGRCGFPRQKRGKLGVKFDPVAIALETGFQILSFSGEDALQLKSLAFHHRDPFDGMLIAQALSNNYAIMTDDPMFSQYPCKLIA